MRRVALLLTLASAGCYGQLPARRTASLRIHAQPPSTTLYVDGEYFGSARVLSRQAKPLSAGKHLVTFMAPGYFPHDMELDLQPGESTIRLKLLAIPP